MTRRRGRNKRPNLPAKANSAPADQAVSVRHEFSSGPLPAPEVLRGYEDLLPGAAERIIRMAEQEQKDSHDIRMIAVRETAADTKRGQYFGIVVALAALGTAAFLGYHGHSTAAGIVGGTTVVGLVWVFVTGRRASGS